MGLRESVVIAEVTAGIVDLEKMYGGKYSFHLNKTGGDFWSVIVANDFGKMYRCWFKPVPPRDFTEEELKLRSELSEMADRVYENPNGPNSDAYRMLELYAELKSMHPTFGTTGVWTDKTYCCVKTEVAEMTRGVLNRAGLRRMAGGTDARRRTDQKS